MVNAFLFDIGNVLVNFDIGKFERALSVRSDLSPDDIREKTTPLRTVYETGIMDDREFVAEGKRLSGFRGNDEEYLEAWADIFTPQPAMSETVRGLHAKGYSLYHLSNTNGIHLEHLRSRYPVFSLFHGGAYSHLAGCMKPDDGIYRTAIAELGLKPEETVYLDDLEPNVLAGRRHGLISLQHDPSAPDEFARWLSEEGLL